MKSSNAARAALAATIALIGAAPSVAEAKGWQLKFSHPIGPLKTHTVGRHCGPSRFGTWSFRAQMRADGQVADIRWKALISQNGDRHQTTGVHVTGTAPANAKAAIKQVMESTSYQYVSSSSLLRTTKADGSTLSTIKFKPHATRHC